MSVPNVYAVSKLNLNVFLQGNAERNGEVAFIAMDVVDYETLSINLAEILRYMQQLEASVSFYEQRLSDVPTK